MQPSQALTVNPYSILESITPAARYSIRLCNAKTDAALGGFPRQLAEIHSRLRQCRFIDRLRQRPVAQDGLDLE